MNQEKENELLEYLKALGFEGEQLTADIRKNTERNMPAFQVQQAKTFGAERVRYDMYFRYDPQFDAARLEEYRAIYRRPVDIGHQVINGVDTAQLEERMKAIDWREYLKYEGSSLPNATTLSADAIIGDLARLVIYNNASGWDIQRRLQFKYWPESTYDAAVIPLQQEYERNRTFVATESGMCHANLAYHVLSGRLDDLYEKLSATGLERFPGIELYSELEKVLSQNPERFDLEFLTHNAEGLVKLNIPVSREDEYYETDTYQATFVPFPPIDHGFYNGVDTAALEKKMQQVNWRDETSIIVDHGDAGPEYTPDVIDIAEQMSKLSQDDKGMEIVGKLQLKYWIDARFFFGEIREEAWDRLGTHPGKAQEFPAELEVPKAVNLLCGRAVLDEVAEPDTWMRLGLQHYDQKEGYPYIRTAFSLAELEGKLLMLPLSQPDHDAACRALRQGDRTPVTLPNNQILLLEANPEKHDLDIYTKDMRPVPVNLHFDPDWKPSTTPELSRQQDKKEVLRQPLRPNRPGGNRKGRRP